MFRQSSSSSSSPSYSDALMHHHAASFSAAMSVAVPRAAGGYLDGGGNVGAFSPPPPCYSSSLPSSYSYYNSLQRSISSHSLPMHLHLADGVSLGGGGGGGFYSPSSPSTATHQQLTTTTLPPLSSSPSSSSGEFFEFTSSCPVRRVFSTGDLQGMNGSSPPRPVGSADGCGQEGGGAGGPFSQKVGRYSAEERKERIERYRVKRHQRNFNKKITYACRKTLADSRPRVKGRFARNGETDAEADEREASGDNNYEYGNGCSHHHNHNELSNGNSNTTAYSTAATSCYDGHYSSRLNGAGAGNSAFSGAAGDNGEWWWRAPGAAAAAAADDVAQRQQQRQVGFDDEDELWATLGDMLSVNLAS